MDITASRSSECSSAVFLLLEIVGVYALYFIDLLDAYANAVLNHVVAEFLAVYEDHFDI
jgi:hypothetical protein